MMRNMNEGKKLNIMAEKLMGAVEKVRKILPQTCRPAGRGHKGNSQSAQRLR